MLLCATRRLTARHYSTDLRQAVKQTRNDTAHAAHAAHARLLTPYTLSRRVDALCKAGNVSAAISLVKSCPLDAQNAIVWATLIRPVLAAQKYQEAYRLFIDMKRRGIQPTSRTFSTLLKGYAQIDDWQHYPLQLDNVFRVYTQITQYHALVERNGGPQDELSNIPYNLLIGIFGKAQRFQHMFDVFNAMPAKGPLAPDMHTFTVLITAIGNRQLSAFPTPSADQDTPPPPLPTPNELAYKNASDAKLIWRQLLRAYPTPDSHAIRAILKPLSRGRPSDHTLALSIAHTHLGLAPPGEPPAPIRTSIPTPTHHAHTLDALLATTTAARRPRHTLHYIQHLIDTHHAHILTRRHMDHALHAHAALAAADPGEAGQALETLLWMLRMHALPPGTRAGAREGVVGGIGAQMRPAAASYDAVALACSNAGDWAGACRVFELMTGDECARFRGGVPGAGVRSAEAGAVPRHAPRFRPSAVFMAHFLRTAAKTRDEANVGLVLNVLGYYGVEGVLRGGEGEVSSSALVSSRRREKAKANVHGEDHGEDQDHDQARLHASRLKLVEALRAVMPRMLASGAYDALTKARWRDMVGRVEGAGAGV